MAHRRYRWGLDRYRIITPARRTNHPAGVAAPPIAEQAGADVKPTPSAKDQPRPTEPGELIPAPDPSQAPGARPRQPRAPGATTTRAQRRAHIADALRNHPELSNREHARRIGCDHKTVGSVRRALD
ncbi:Hypothetical protein MUW33_2784 [Mycobacterium canetti]|uniref:hypothetical protein n=1 Tax=Mycobacterium canetti TaxID=78331 RepID=UPI002D7A1E2F|nr:hypothetical protein [Mycobacterium canetti]WRO42734.1 Hypothetical protein MUW33_2784 [Mycobacterium canetti]